MPVEAIRRRIILPGELSESREGGVIQGEYNGPSFVDRNGTGIIVPILRNADTPEGIERAIELPRSVEAWEVGGTFNLQYEVTREKVKHMLRIIGGNAHNRDHMHIARALVGDSPLSAFYFVMGNDKVVSDNESNILPKTTALFIVQDNKVARPLEDGNVEITVEIVKKGKTSITVAHSETQKGEIVKDGKGVLSFQNYPFEPKPKSDREDLDYSNFLRIGKQVRTNQKEVRVFAGEISGDLNPAHRKKDYAERTVFGGTIAHGLISLGKALIEIVDYAREMGEIGTIDGYSANFKNAVLIDTTKVTNMVKRPAIGSNVYDFISVNQTDEPIIVGSITFAK